MGYRELNRMEIIEVVRHWQAGTSQRGVARATGLARETVKKYLAAAAALWTIGIQARSMNRPCQVSVRLAVSLCWPGSHRPILHRKPATMPLVPFDPRLVPLFMASLMSVGLGVIALRRRTPGARAFAVLLIASAAWSATYALESPRRAPLTNCSGTTSSTSDRRLSLQRGLCSPCPTPTGGREWLGGPCCSCSPRSLPSCRR